MARPEELLIEGIAGPHAAPVSRMLAWLAALTCLLRAAAPAAGDVVVEELRPSFAAHAAGLEPGDVLVRWERSAGLRAPASGSLDSPFDLEEVEREEAPRGRVTLFGTRDGAPLVVRMPPGDWRLEARPGFGADVLQAYERQRALVAGEDAGLGLTGWTRLAVDLRNAGDPTSAVWLSLRVARAAEARQDPARAEAAMAAALEAAGGAASPYLPWVHVASGRLFENQGEWKSASEAYDRALTAEGCCAQPSLGEAAIRIRRGNVRWKQGELAPAHEEYSRSLALREQLAPDSLAVAWSLMGLANVARERGDLAEAAEHYRRALRIQERLAPESLDVAGTLNGLGIVASMRRDFAGAEESYRRSLAIRERLDPDGLLVAQSLGNLGAAMEARGDLDDAERLQRRALAIRKRLEPGGFGLASSLNNLGEIAARRGDLSAAEAYHTEALAIRTRLAPRSLIVAASLNTLGFVAWQRGDLAGGEGHLRAALAIQEALGPHTMEAGDTWQLLGEVALSRGDLAAAEAHFTHALEIRTERAPGSVDEARACQRLAFLHRRLNRREQALAFYAKALAALDSQRRVLGGTDEGRTRFGARHADAYRETVDLLMELGRPEEAFHVLERYRARGLLDLLAERDLVFTTDVPAELDAERRRLTAEYDRALERLAARRDEADKSRDALLDIRARQTAVEQRIRAASPRLAELQYPEPLDLRAARGALDAGTLLLAYSVGDRQSYLFAVGPGPDDFAAVSLGTNLATLRAEVVGLRQLLQRPGQLGKAELQMRVRRLGTRLLSPVARQIARARRLLILPDGPLHLIPFAVLGDPSETGRQRFLVEGRPVHVAASVSVFAELAKKRQPGRPPTLVAFGDPDYSAVAAEAETPGPRSAARTEQQRGALRALPATRREVESLRRLYSPAVRTYLGVEATEERAKAVDTETSLLHFACHGFADESSPLDSSLALSMPPNGVAGRDNGLLQAWEVFERVRIDADLVTLSACSTALGKEMSGEGILGLTRAFQFAGAHSVLASLWEVGDESTTELMRRFYGHLKAGRTKDEALRAAQMEMIRSGPFSHPHQWAAFQLLGDWR